MPDALSKPQALMVRLVAVLVPGLIILGVLWYGLSADVHTRLWHHIFGRMDGPMTFRFILQPAMAALAALHDGVQDARADRAPYFWTMLTNPAKRAGRLREGFVSTARIILLGLGMDALYQYFVLKTFYPGEMAVIALLLAFVPYVLLRGPITRVARVWMSRR
ncbi:MAG: hypothetical protein ABW110_11885 [Steroidobacteraceae bacterium]